MTAVLCLLSSGSRWLFSAHGSQDLYFRYWYNEAPAPLPDVTHLLHDLFLQIPGKDQEVIRFCGCDYVGMVDWNVRPGQIMALLMRASIDGIIDEVRSHAAIIQQRVSFGGRTIADDGFSLILGLYQEFDQSALG